MNIQPITITSITSSKKDPSYKRKYLSNPQDIITFKSLGFSRKVTIPQRFLNKFLHKNLCNCNLEKLEGAQNGLKTFDGLSMKQIAIALTNLHSINMISGCKRHCLHCYANAQPFFRRSLFEDFEQICNDIKELSKRTGANSCFHHGAGYINIGFDTDALDCHLFDQKGEKHDFIDLAKLLYESTGYGPVFDTNGWDSIEKQKIAEEYVTKLLENNNFDLFHQINISINPFNPKYVKALKSGYPQEDLYQPFKKILLYSDCEEKIPENLEKAQKLYTNYIKNTANALITFKPLIKTGKLGVIIRALDDEITNMPGFRIVDFIKTLNNIYTELYLRKLGRNITEEELAFFGNELSSVSNRMFSSGRMEKFYKVSNNGQLNNIEKIDSDRECAKERLDKIKKNGKLSAGNLRYLKMIAPDGKVYFYDNYSIIPSDIQLKTSIKNIEKPFQIKVEDFILTENMVDIF